MSLVSEIIDAIVSGRVSDREQLQRLKSELCQKHRLSRMPSNPEILAEVPPGLRAKVEPLLRLKPVRSLSGISVVAAMASPAACPHGKCIYCPGGPEYGTAQSYTGHEPAARRAAANSFDPFLQARSRLRQLSEVGHPIDKIELIVMGGTFPARDLDYQERFVLRCFDAMNGSESDSIEEAHGRNEVAPSRCVGLTIETRPDQFSQEQISHLMWLGMTRVEIGVQTVFESHLSRLERGHTVSDSIASTARAKLAGLKVCYHLMPGLPGATVDSDLEMFREVFEDQRFRPDMLKIYPTLVLRGTELFDMWQRGEYAPPDTEYIVGLLTKAKRIVPEWVRIQRVQRDIPLSVIEAGAAKSNARQLIAERLASEGARCRCIRCREVGHLGDVFPESVELLETSYQASDGLEHFIQYADPSTDALVGFARLRIDHEAGGSRATIRELRVYGQQVPIDVRLEEAFQHRGLGRLLIERCEELSLEGGVWDLRVTSGVGVRGYYRRLGYELVGCYMSKRLSSS